MFRQQKEKNDGESEKLASIPPTIAGSHTVVFLDFDGVVVDSAACFLAAAEDCAKIINRDTSFDSYQSLIDFKLGLLSHPLAHFMKSKFESVFIQKVMKHFEGVISGLNPYEGLMDALTMLKRQGVKILLVTRHHSSNVALFLEHANMQGLIDEIASSEGKSLSAVMHKTTKQHGKDCPYIVGHIETVDDVKRFARPVGAGWGFASPEQFSSANVNHILDSPNELVRLVQVGIGVSPQAAAATSSGSRLSI